MRFILVFLMITLIVSCSASGVKKLTSGNILDGKTKRIDFDLKLQMEAGCYKEDDAIYFTSEAEGGGVGKVYEVWLEDWI